MLLSVLPQQRKAQASFTPGLIFQGFCRMSCFDPPGEKWNLKYYAIKSEN
jgi:hypothetical protein